MRLVEIIPISRLRQQPPFLARFFAGGILWLVGLWQVRDRYMLKGTHSWMLLGFSALIALSGFLPHAPVPVTLLLVVCLVVRLRSEKRRGRFAHGCSLCR